VLGFLVGVLLGVDEASSAITSVDGSLVTGSDGGHRSSSSSSGPLLLVLVALASSRTLGGALLVPVSLSDLWLCAVPVVVLLVEDHVVFLFLVLVL